MRDGATTTGPGVAAMEHGANGAAGPDWQRRVPEEEARVYRRVIREARAGGVRFAFGGAFATAVYTGELCNTKDLDFYIWPADRRKMIDAISRAGLRDHFDLLPYDRLWIYRASHDGILVDAIWAMANQRALVDPVWLTRGPLVPLLGEVMRAIPAEELIWSKLYVLQRERCDWGDILNIISCQARALDWDRLIDRLEGDTPLLAGVLGIFGWLDPGRAQQIPAAVWSRLGLVPPSPARARDSDRLRNRAALLDSRPWYASAGR